MTRRRKARSQTGHLIIVLMVGIAVSSIMLGKAMESWQTLAQRDREEELIFRGESYVEAIRLFQQKMGHLPVELEQLHKKPHNFIRKLYPDPMTKDDEGNWGGTWGIIHSTPTGQPILPGQPIPGLPGQEGQQGQQGQQGGREEQTSESSFGSSFGTSPGGGPILGVYSTNEEESIKVYDGKTQYNEWFFYLKPEQPQQGQPGQGNPPGGGNPPGQGTPPGGEK